MKIVFANRITGLFFNGVNFSARSVRDAKVFNIANARDAQLAFVRACWQNVEPYQLASDGSFAMRLADL